MSGFTDRGFSVTEPQYFSKTDVWQVHPGIDLLVVINGSPYERGKSPLRRLLAQTRAGEVDAPHARRRVQGGDPDRSHCWRSNQTSSAFWACRRFSASSQTTDCGPSMTSASTS